MQVMRLGGKWLRVASNFGFCYEIVQYFIVQFCDFRNFYEVSIFRQMVVCFLYLNVWIFNHAVCPYLEKSEKIQC
jgi:hypothetical protein